MMEYSGEDWFKNQINQFTFGLKAKHKREETTDFKNVINPEETNEKEIIEKEKRK